MLNKEWFLKKCKTLNFHKNVYVGYSGGVDSGVLLHLLNFASKKLCFKLKAIHVNHLYHIYADRWSFFCKKACDKLGVPISIYKIDNKLIYTEEYLRLERFKIFSEKSLKNSNLLLAHNENDFFETIFLNLFRGTGLAGLTGIKSNSKIKNINVIRPLINVSRENIIKYANEYKISYILDFSNFNLKLNRNYVRYKLFPIMLNSWGKFEKQIYNCSQVCDNIYNMVYKKSMCFFLFKGFFYKFLLIKYLDSLPKFWRYEVIRLWIKRYNRKSPAFSQIKEVDKILISKNSGKSLVKIGSFCIKRYKNYIYISEYIYRENRNIIIFTYINKKFINNLYKILHLQYANRYKQIYNLYKYILYNKNLLLILNKKNLILIFGYWVSPKLCYYKNYLLFKALK